MEDSVHILTRTVFKWGWSHKEHFPGDQLSPDEITKGQGNNIFHVAAKYHKSPTEKLDPFLPEYPSKAYEQNARGDTPLHIAARLGKLDFATRLVEHARGIDVEGGYRNLLRIENEKKNTALHEAVGNGHNSIAKLLIEEDPKLACFESKAGESPLFLAVDRGYHQIALTILETFPNCSVLGRNGMTAMHAAVIRDQSCSVEDMLRKCGPVILEIQDEIGWMPHHYAADMGKSRIIERFLQAKSPLAYIVDGEGMSALHISARNGHINVIKTVIQNCPDVCELSDKKGRTALHVAVEHKQVSVVKTLLKTKAFTDLLNEQDKDGNAALHLACLQGHYEIISSLLNDSRTNKRMINKLGMTAFDIIDGSSRLDLFQQLRIRRKCKGELHLLNSLQGAAAPGNQTKNDHHEITPINYESRMPQPNGEAPVKSKKTKYKKAGKIAADLNLVVATLIASITFTAAMSMPGGYHNSTGLATLRKRDCFERFLVFDSIAFGCSAASMLTHFSVIVCSSLARSSLIHSSLSRSLIIYSIQLPAILTFISIVMCMFAFIAGTKAVLYEKQPLSHYYGLPGTVAVVAFYVIILIYMAFPILYISFLKYRIKQLAPNKAHAAIDLEGPRLGPI